MGTAPDARAFGVGGIPPLQIHVSATLLIDCPRHGRVDVSTCYQCPLLQGTLEGMGLVMLCGFRSVARRSGFASAAS
jgi:hypothetical protein